MSELYVVTGGAGFIGSHVVEELTRMGRRVRVLDNFDTGLEHNLAHLSPKPEIIRGSLTELQDVERALAGASVVYHLGAMASVAKSIEDPLGCHAVCATGTLNVLVVARKAGVRRIVYAASSSAYGSASDPDGQDEDTPLCALSPYAAAKLTGELYLQAFAATYGIETVRLRFFNIFGPRQRADSPYSGVIAIFVGLMTSGRVPIVHGDGGQSRDFTYVADAVQAVVKAGDAPGVSGKVFNVGVGGSISVLDLIDSLNTLLGTNVRPTFAPARLGDVRFSRAKIARIREGLSYIPSVTFHEGLRRTLEWYQHSAKSG